jgi:hypothetical protein
VPDSNWVDRILSHIRGGKQLDARANVSSARVKSNGTSAARRPKTHVIPAADLREALTSSVSDPDPEGLILSGAEVKGRLELRHLVLNYPLRFEHCTFPDGMDFSGATLTQLRLEHVELGGAEAALDLSGATFRGDLLLRQVSIVGRVELMQSDIRGRLEVDGTITAKGTALDMDGAQIGGDLSLVGAFDGAGTRGTLRLASARVGGRLVIDSGTHFSNPNGPALSAGGLRVAREAELVCDALGAGSEGAITFQAADIGGSLQIFGVVANGTTGPAFDGNDLHVVRDLRLKAEFEGSGKQGAVILRGAKLDQSADFGFSTINSKDSFAVAADGMQVGTDLLIDGLTAIRGRGKAGVVRLSSVQVAGTLRLAPDSATNLLPGAPVWVVDGLTYEGYPQLGDNGAGSLTKRWLALLSRNPTYPASAYQQFAAAARAAGHDSDVREILIAQRRDQIRRGGLSTREQLWAKFTGITLGYGYQPWRALLFLAGVIVTTMLLSLVLGTFGALTVRPAASTGPAPAATASAQSNTRSCTRIEQIGVALDKSIPLVKNGASDYCKPSSTAAGSVWTVTSWILQLLGWGFATLFVAGFTGAVRKT